MLRLTIAVCTLALCLGLGLDDEWAEFKSTYGKTYNLAVEQLRKNIFASNLIKIAEHNNKADLGLSTYRLGVNEYADLLSEEFKRFFLGFKYDATNTSSRGETYEPTIADHELPKEVDWRSKGYVTPVKNQKQCGSCWAFSTTGSLEGQHFKATGKLVSLSEQNLMDCSKKEGNMGCEGGLMDQAFSYVKKNDGLDTETSYPYKAKDEKCHFRKLDVGATLKAYKDIAKHSEKDLEKAVAEIGPISVAIDASHASFQLYKSGVYNEPKCSQKMLDHGVLAVGFGEKEGKKYWLVKNSWGATWGEKGYIMMSKDKDNQCGIATQASFPVCNK